MDANLIMEIVQWFTTLVIIPAVFLVFKMNTKIVILETRLNNKKEFFSKLFENDVQTLKNLNDLNVKIEKLTTQIEGLY